VDVHPRCIAPRNDETHDPAGNPATARKRFDLDSRIIVAILHPPSEAATFQIAANQMPAQLSARKVLASRKPFISRTVVTTDLS
jgi:hypothetical protein